jgi:YhcH/YjgK/YiaL family protein
MITDTLENSHLYTALPEGIADGLKAIADPALADKNDGRHDIDGDRIFALVQRYSTKDKPDALFEAHRHHIDIQVILEGEETIGYAPAETLEVIQPYEFDVYKCADPEVFTEIKLRKGMFSILYPGDAHKPCYDYGEGKSQVHKICLKIRV